MTKIIRAQRGVTLIELLVSLCVTALIASGVTGLIFHEFKGTTSVRNTVTAAREIGIANDYICRDVMMAKNTGLAEGGEPENELHLSWIDRYEFSNIPHYCSYSLNGTSLQRCYDGTTRVIAHNITDIGFYIEAGMLNVSISYTPKAWETKTVEKTYSIFLRPGEVTSIW
jgi:prepilin-type N-terminal cleavage/methylation domain-containing protein